VSARLEGGALIVRIGSMRRAFLVGGALGFVAVGALMLAFGSLFVRIVGALSVVTFGTFLVVGLVQIVRGPSQLVLTPEWLRRDTGARGREVRWDEVVRVARVDQDLPQSIVEVCAREPEARETIATEATLRRLQA
jgi:hypothetical protein